MRFEDLSPKQVERAKGCETAEERMAFVAENGIELTDEQLEGIAGGRHTPPWKVKTVCPKSPAFDGDGPHKYVPTGRTRPGRIFGDLWPDKEERCKYCGDVKWVD